MSPFTPTRLAAFGAATAVVTGTLAAAPVASASVSRISIATAGSKPVNQATYAWGTVTGGNGIRACAQVLVGGTWQTQWAQCVTTGSTGGYSIRLTYNEGTPGTTTWRVVSGGAVSASKTLTRTGGSTAPSKPSTGKVDYAKGKPGGDTLVYGDNGVKVYLVQNALGVPADPMSTRMGNQTVAAVKRFQNQHGLAATGDVDAQTFYAIKQITGKIPAAYNFDIDAWKQGSNVSPGASRQTRINAMINFAKAQINKPYIWGGTGPMGYDCSGLLLQALRAGGYDPKGVSNLNDVQPPSNLSQRMFSDGEFSKANANAPQLGDLIYYGNSSSTVHHVAMYVGSVPGLTGPQVLNAIGQKVQYSPYNNFTAGWNLKVGANRMP